MKNILLNVGLAALMALPLRGERPPSDAVGTAWDAAAKAILEGKPRGEIAGPLEEAALKLPQSWWHDQAMAMARALRKSEADLQRAAREGSTKVSEPWRWLAESEMPNYLVSIAENKRGFERFVKERPEDPATLLIAAGRGSIEKLLPLLRDQAPTRGTSMLFTFDGYQVQRTSDLALAIIERLSGCSFCERVFSFGPYSDLPEDVRLSAIEAAKAWWKKSGALGFSEGIRAWMPEAGYYGRLRMARVLATGETAADREYARNELRQMFDKPGQYMTSYAAEALWAIGDRYPLERIVVKFQERTRGDVKTWTTSQTDVWFLATHGGKAEWDLLTRVARAQIDAGLSGKENLVCPDLGGCAYMLKSPYAIPALALAATVAIDESDAAGAGKTDQADLGRIWSCAHALQRITGEDLGLGDFNVQDEQRRKSLKAVRTWWQHEGRQKYTLEKIEERLDKGPPFGG